MGERGIWMDEIASAVERAREIPGAIAVRVLGEKDPARKGSYLRRSEVYDDGSPTGEFLPGTSCLRLDRDYSRLNGAYMGDRIAVVSGYSLMEGDDPGEIVVQNARVVAILKKAVK